MVLKSTDNSSKASDKLEVVGNALGNIPVDMTRVTKSGDVVLQIKAEDVKKAAGTLMVHLHGSINFEFSMKHEAF